jgi:hypothetical protein
MLISAIDKKAVLEKRGRVKVETLQALIYVCFHETAKLSHTVVLSEIYVGSCGSPY